MRRSFLAAPLVAALLAAVAQAETPWIELRVDPLVDLFTQAWQATGAPSPFSTLSPPREEGAPKELPGLETLEEGEALLAAARRIHHKLAHPLMWGLLLTRLYQRMGKVASAVREPWVEWLDGERGRDAALDLAIARLTQDPPSR